jgi:glycosyltransferase involved in cell wall biosynthesis
MRCTLGGAEKRYARVFEMLVDQTNGRHQLLINRSMLNLLQGSGILIDYEPHLTVLEPPFRQFAQAHGIPRSLCPFFALLDGIWYTWQCWRVIHHSKPEIVHPLLTGIYFSLPALILHPRIGHVMSAYSSQFISERDKRVLGIPVGATIKRWAMQHSHAIDALRGSIRDDLVTRGIDEEKIDAAPCSFTDISQCQPASKREKWVVFLGRFIENKDPLLLARAIPQVIAHHPDAHFYLLGEGYLRNQLESLVRELGIVDHVTIRFEPHPTEILNQSSIFASLQVLENYPSQSLLEAMACGNAIVATDVGETWRLVDEQNGIRISPNKTALANAIIQLLNDPELSQKQQASQQRVFSEHTPERFFQYITQVYWRAAKGNTK